ncbi:MAG TPA: DUF5317 family protein [Acidimicrobiales bacterium]|nr:DUF5317 family protein [Acidimicrobiales bacterium]
MRFTTVALFTGVAIGLLTGGKLGNLGRRRFRAWPLLAAGAALQFVPAGAALLLSYLCLLAFALANITVVGMGVLTVGLGLNALVVSINGGMPVRRAALDAARLARPGEAVVYSGKRHLEQPGDRLPFLGDIVPVPALREVLSFGDLVMAVGLAAALAWLARNPPDGRHAAEDPAQLAGERAGNRDR